MSIQGNFFTYRFIIIIALTVSLLMPTIVNSAAHETAMLTVTKSDRHIQFVAVTPEHSHSHEDDESEGQGTYHMPAHGLADHPHDHHAPANLSGGYFLILSGSWNVVPPPSVILDRPFKIDRPPRA